MSRVLWRDAQGQEGAIDLMGGETRIGRAMDCAIRSDDAMVSRHHARIFWNGGQWVLEDLGSANGVFYQEQRVTQHPMKHGDAVRCGSLWLRFIDPDGNAAQVGPGPQGNSPAPPPIGGGGAPPPAGPGPAPGPAPPPAGGPPGPMPGGGGGGSAHDQEEIKRLNRRIEQLQTELRVLRGGQRGATMEDLENDLDGSKRENTELQAKVKELEQRFEKESASAQVADAKEIKAKANEIVANLNDLLSNLRINVMAAEGEFEQYASQIPKASFELIREALRSSSGDVDKTRELLRALREIAS
jgi:hypothetical protein